MAKNSIAAIPAQSADDAPHAAPRALVAGVCRALAPKRTAETEKAQQANVSIGGSFRTGAVAVRAIRYQTPRGASSLNWSKFEGSQPARNLIDYSPTGRDTRAPRPLGGTQ